MRIAAFLSIAAVMFVPAAFSADASAGKAVYTKRCQSCHGPGGQGNPNVAKMLNATIKPLSSGDVQSKGDADLKKEITGGVGKMKPIKLTDAEATDVVAFVRTLK